MSQDFVMYELEYLRFVRTPRGRAVLKAGGLYWQIALFVLQSVNISAGDMFSILSGPSNDLGVAPLSINDAESGLSLLDDSLTKEEIVFLSGAYLTPTGEFTLSFIVLPHFFCQELVCIHRKCLCGLHPAHSGILFWTLVTGHHFANVGSRAESKPLNLALASCRKSTKWNDELFRFKKTARMITGSRQLSSKFLDTIFT